MRFSSYVVAIACATNDQNTHNTGNDHRERAGTEHYRDAQLAHLELRELDAESA